MASIGAVVQPVAEREQLGHRFDLRDQASIIGRRLQRQGTSIGQEVATRFASARTSLDHQLLASLGVREAVTTNDDTLHELAAAAGGGSAVAVLPYQAPAPGGVVAGDARQRGGSDQAPAPGGWWLLTLHGSIDREETIT